MATAQWPVSHCASPRCGAPIVWARTEAGKTTPVDLEPSAAGNTELFSLDPDRTPQARVVPVVERAAGHLGRRGASLVGAHPRGGDVMRLCAIAAYLATIVAANWLTARYGFVPVGWDRHTLVAGTGQGSNGWQNRTEVIWSNRPLGRQLTLDLVDDGEGVG